MKKSILIIMSLLLFSCSSDKSHLDENFRVIETLKASPEIVEEKLSYYIHDDMAPNYVMLSSYPFDSLIDWDDETGVNVKMNPELRFEFTKEEAIRGLEIHSKNLKSIMVNFSGQKKIYTIYSDYQIITFEEALLGKDLTIIPYETTDESTVLEIHITGNLNVDKTTFEVFEAIEANLSDFKNNYKWSIDPIQSMLTYQVLLEEYTLDNIEVLTKDFDASRLLLTEEDYVGAPYKISGKIISVKERNNYNELTVETIIDHEIITIYTMDKFIENEIFKESCILIDQKNILTFITIQ